MISYFPQSLMKKHILIHFYTFFYLLGLIIHLFLIYIDLNWDECFII